MAGPVEPQAGGAPAASPDPASAPPAPPAARFVAAPPLSLYVHIPWCVSKCPYCDFNSHAATGAGAASGETATRAAGAAVAARQDAYVDALLADLERQLPSVWRRTVETIFIGGGTPSLFAPAAIDRLLSGLRALLPLRPALEVTLEANPGTLEQGRFAEFRAAGVNRLSLGVQSFNDGHLDALGRIHDGAAARRALEAAHRAGFEQINADLMFALPRQTPAEAAADLATLLALRPTHVSYYQLTLEPNTWFHHHPPPLPDDEQAWRMQQHARAVLAEAGFVQYEVSAYARPGARCRHNLNYWRFGDYLGIGAGAHGKLTDAGAGVVERTWKLKQPSRYLAAGDPVGGRRRVGPGELPLEFMLNALRLVDGVPVSLFVERTGLQPAVIAPALRRARELDLLFADTGRLQPTAHGMQFLNDLLALFLPDTDPSDL